MALSAGQTFGVYEVLAFEGAGGMGEVYRARDTRLHRTVALKVLPARIGNEPHAVARLQREACLLAAVNHANIAAIHGLEERDGISALVLEYVDGCTLADRIASGRLPYDEVRPIALRIASALSAAHDAGVIHRDLKPSNIRLRVDGAVKVLDFGLAKALDDSDAQAAGLQTITMPDEGPVGSVAYMSPEQIRGEPVDKRTDLWALGCVLYEMLTGRRAFEGATQAQTIAAVLTGTPDWSAVPADVPPAVVSVMRRALERDGSARLRDAGAVALVLEGMFDAANSSRASGAAARLLPRDRRWLSWGSIGAVAAIAIFGLNLWPSALEHERTVVYPLYAPAGSQYPNVTMQPYPALSPDGRLLAFTAFADETMLIWVHEIGTLAGRPLAGTEGGSSPFWSPDGQHVGFIAGDVLRRVSVAGDRPAQVLCNCDPGSGAAWADGTILFAKRSGLWKISDRGGTPERVTHLDPSRGEIAHRWPVMLPGNDRRFVYLIRSTREEHRGVYLGSLENPNIKRRLTPDDSNAGFGVGPDGRPYLVFVRGQNLLAQPFRLGTAEIQGEPLVIDGPIRPGETGRLAPFTVRGRTLVYRRADPLEERLVWISRQGLPERQIWLDRQEYRHPSLSPDGKRLTAILRDARSGLDDLWVFDLEREVGDRLTHEPISVSFPIWAPDGRRIAFAATRSGAWDVYARAVDHAHDEEALYRADSPLVKYPSGFTPDGRYLLFHDSSGTSLLPLTGRREPTHLVRGVQARVSPNGRWLAFTAVEGAARHVYVSTFPAVAERWRVSPAYGSDPQWRADGRELYYVDREQTLVAVPIDPATGAPAGPQQPLFRATFEKSGLRIGRAYAPAPDGSRFLVNEVLRDPQYPLWTALNWAPAQGGRRVGAIGNAIP
jgi:Tol biopolymer transport system component